jgi:hypothetical protein
MRVSGVLRVSSGELGCGQTRALIQKPERPIVDEMPHRVSVGVIAVGAKLGADCEGIRRRDTGQRLFWISSKTANYFFVRFGFRWAGFKASIRCE